MKLIGTTFAMLGIITSCGAANVNKIFGSKDESTSGLLQKAQIAYDRGDIDTAEDYATQAYDSTSNNGDAAVLLGSIMLSRAGIDIVQLVKKMSELSSTKTSTTTSTSTNCTTTSTDAAGSISKLSCLLLDLSAADIAALGSEVALTSDGLKSLGSYYKPADVDDALRAKVSVLKYADKGIRVLCPFVNREAVLKTSIDERHALATCGDKTSTEYNPAKIHIAFGLLHLVETLVYQRGVLVDGVTKSGSASKVGISTISSSINTQNFTSVSAFVATMNEFKTVVDALADTSNNKSQIALAIDGLSVVATSFGQAGIPSKVVSSITSGLAKLKETADKLSKAAGGTSSGNYQAQALKGQINEKYASTVASKINTVCGADGSSCTAAQKTELCTTYTGISQGVDTTKVSKPTICQ